MTIKKAPYILNPKYHLNRYLKIKDKVVKNYYHPHILRILIPIFIQLLILVHIISWIEIASINRQPSKGKDNARDKENEKDKEKDRRKIIMLMGTIMISKKIKIHQLGTVQVNWKQPHTVQVVVLSLSYTISQTITTTAQLEETTTLPTITLPQVHHTKTTIHPSTLTPPTHLTQTPTNLNLWFHLLLNNKTHLNHQQKSTKKAV